LKHRGTEITEVIRKSEITTEYTEDTEDRRQRELIDNFFCVLRASVFSFVCQST